MSGVQTSTARRVYKGATLPATCSPGQIFLKDSGGSEGLYICITANTWILLDAAAGDGTVTSVSVTSGNGLAGSVANPTTTPAITLSTTITGLLKGNGTAISAAASGTDYLAPAGDGSALTGLTKSQVGLGNVDNTSDATKNAAAVTLTNKTLTSPVINTPTGIVKGDVGLGNVDNTSDATKDAAVATLTNKTVALGNNTVSGTTAEFNTALSDGDFATLAGAETLTNKTLTSPIINTPSASGQVYSTTYSPTIAAFVANLDNAVLTAPCSVIRVGSVVTVAGSVTIDPTLTATDTYFSVSLPVASNFTSTGDAGGTGASWAIAGQVAAAVADVTNDVVLIRWKSLDTTSQIMSFSFTYIIK